MGFFISCCVPVDVENKSSKSKPYPELSKIDLPKSGETIFSNKDFKDKEIEALSWKLVELSEQLKEEKKKSAELSEKLKEKRGSNPYL